MSGIYIYIGFRLRSHRSSAFVLGSVDHALVINAVLSPPTAEGAALHILQFQLAGVLHNQPPAQQDRYHRECLRSLPVWNARTVCRVYPGFRVHPTGRRRPSLVFAHPMSFAVLSPPTENDAARSVTLSHLAQRGGRGGSFHSFFGTRMRSQVVSALLPGAKCPGIYGAVSALFPLPLDFHLRFACSRSRHTFPADGRRHGPF